MNHSVLRRPCCLAKSSTAALIALASSGAAVQRQRRAVRRDRRQLGVVDVDRDHLGAEGAAPPARSSRRRRRADDDRPGCPASTPGALHRLVRRGQRIGDDRDLGQRQAGLGQARFVDFAQAARRHHDVAGEAALDVVARHLLLRGRWSTGRAGTGRIRRTAAPPAR